MARAKKIDDKLKEEIKAHYASCGVMNQTAKAFNVSVSTVHKIVTEEKDEVESLRKQKKQQWIEEAWKTINLYMQHVQDPKVIAKTSARDSAILIGTLHDKMLKAQELELKRQELELKRKEIEEATDTTTRVVIVNDVDEMRKVLNERNQNNSDN
jgi:Stage III sporulation protein D